MSIHEIVNGCDRFPGLIPIVQEYLGCEAAAKECIDAKTSRKLAEYLTLVGDRASGKAKTTASLMRSLVRSHPKYQFDSVVTNEIAYNLMWKLNQISNQIDNN